MFSNDSYALLIGVDDYSTFDRSRSQAAGTSDLLGSRNDVRTFWRILRLIGVKADHIRVLATPPIPAAELEGATAANVGPATKAEILAGAAWLADKLGHHTKPTGILTYSGHGDWQADQGLVLCPSDATAVPDAGGEPSLANTVSFGALNHYLKAHAENLTVVLDTCHSGAGEHHATHSPGHHTGKALTLTRRSLSKLPGIREKGLEDLAGRVLAATGRDQIAYQSMFDGQHRGVFSWAVSAALEQWRASQERRNVRIDLSYAKLVETAGRVMSALWFDQTPELQARAGVAELAVFQHGTVGLPGQTTALPDGGLKTEEIDPGTKDFLIYTIADSSGTQLGQVLVTSTAGSYYAANTEYWFMTSNISNSAAVTFTGSIAGTWRHPPQDLGVLSFSVSRTPTWSYGASSSQILVYNSGGELDGLDWQMSNANGVWTGTVTWWHQTNSNNMFGAGVIRTLSPSSTSYTGYYAVSRVT